MLRGKTFTRIGAAVLAASALALAGCSSNGGGGGNNGGDGSTEVVVGATLPLTGFGAPYGLSMKEGMEIGIADAQEALDGTTLKLEMTDSQAAAGPAVSEGRKLMADEGAAVVATAFSAPPLAQLSIAEQYQVPLMNAGGNTPDLANHEWLFNNSFGVAQGGYAMMDYAHNELGVNSLAVIVDSSYPESMPDAYIELWNEVAPGEPISVEYIASDTTDAGPNIDKLLAGDPDAFFLSTNGAALSLVLNQLVQRNISIPVLSNDGAILGAPEAATLPFLVYYANNSTVASEEFTAAYNEAYGKDPDFLALAYYNMSLVIGQVVAKLQESGEEINGANFQNVLADTSNTYTVDGGATLQYGEDHFANVEASIVKYENGQGTVVAEDVPTGP